MTAGKRRAPSSGGCVPARRSNRGVTSGGLPTDLDAHRAALARCRLCHELPPDSRPIVSLARWQRVLLVGQAPGKVEQGGGKPFAGRAGHTLFRWFEQAGLDEETVRETVYIAAITRCYPGPNRSGRGDRLPSRAERERCSRWLDAELAIIRPRVIVPVGRLAVDRFLGPVPLAEVVGRAIPISHPAGHSIAIALPHPSGASGWLNASRHKELLADALGLLRDELARAGGDRSR